MPAYQKHGINAEIDKEMLPLIEAMNDLGLRTTSCCSGHRKKMAQIAFKIEDCHVLIADGIVSINWRRKERSKHN